MNWGHKLTVFIVCFMGMIILLVYKSMEQTFHLVTDDYYAEGTSYQEQIDRIDNARTAGELNVAYDDDADQLRLSFPDAFGQTTQGDVFFYRPSDATIDFSVPLALNDSGDQTIDLRDRQAGLWRLKVRWESAGKAFYHEQNVVL